MIASKNTVILINIIGHTKIVDDNRSLREILNDFFKAVRFSRRLPMVEQNSIAHNVIPDIGRTQVILLS